MDGWIGNLTWTGLAVVLVIVNGFFVAAEFALVKVRPTRLQDLARDGRAFSGTASWLHDRLDRALSACQLGITMASLGLGWVGEPAAARLLEPVLSSLGITSPALVHGIAFAVGFTVITAAHLIIGEQAPKIFAIREPERMALWCAVPLKWFYLAAYPLLVGLSAATNVILRAVGVDTGSAHDTPHTEQELRVLIASAHVKGEITRSEQRLIDAVFEFDDTVCRQVMVPRVDVAILDVGRTVPELLGQAREGKFSRYPLCDGSLDEVLGVLHIKDLVGLDPDAGHDLRTLARPPRFVPESMRISRLLRHFQAARQHLAFVVDEHGSVIGIVTMENVLERIVGEVEDEFDTEAPDVVPDGPGRYLVQGSSPIDIVNRSLGLSLASADSDTISGLLTERLGRIVEAGDRVELPGAEAEILEAANARALRIRVTVAAEAEEPGSS